MFGPCIQPPIIAHINRVRYEYHKTFVCPDKSLQTEAQRRADYIMRTNDFSHEGFINEFQGKDVRGENLAKYYGEDYVVQAWLDSPLHKALLLGNWSEIAVATSGVYTVLWMRE